MKNVLFKFMISTNKDNENTNNYDIVLDNEFIWIYDYQTNDNHRYPISKMIDYIIKNTHTYIEEEYY